MRAYAVGGGTAQEVGVRTHEVGGNSIIANKKYKREEVYLLDHR